MAVDVEDHVVGAAGGLPKTVDTTLVHPDSPCGFTALSLRKYVSPLVNPVTM